MFAILWLLAVLSTLAAGYFVYRSDRLRAVPYPWLTAGLRAVVIALAWALLLAPTIHIVRTVTEKPVIVFLQDESASIPTALKGDTATYGQSARELMQKLSQKYRLVSWGFGSDIKPDSLFRYGQGSTDISAPLARVQEFYGSQNLGAIILATDGRFNQGLHPLYQSLALRSPLYAVSIGDTELAKDLRISQVYSNRTVAKGAQVEIRADLVATRCAGYDGSVQIAENGATLGTAALSIATDRFDKSVGFTIKAGTPGLHHYVISCPLANGESNTANNRKDVFIEVVESKKRILIATSSPHPDVAAIREALSSTDAYTVSVRDGLPDNPADYDILILHGLSAANILNELKNKGVWYIVTPSTGSLRSNALANELSPSAPHDAYPAINTAFSAFTPPKALAAVLDRLPPLSSVTGTVAAGAGTQTLFYQRGSTTALWMLQPGSAPRAFLFGEGLWRWRFYEYRYFHNHDVIDECIRQTVALLAANTSDAPFRVNLPKYEWSDGENISLDAYLVNAAGEQINGPDAHLTLTDSAGRHQTFSFDKNGSAYRLNMGRMPAGAYSFTASTAYEGKRLAFSGSFVVSSVPIEAMESGADYPLLHAIAKKYGGSAVRSPDMASLYDSILKNDSIRPMLQSRDTTVPLVDWKWYFFLILLVAAIEWLLRKYWLAQ